MKFRGNYNLTLIFKTLTITPKLDTTHCFIWIFYKKSLQVFNLSDSLYTNRERTFFDLRSTKLIILYSVKIPFQSDRI